jgi:hypothetical protein
VGFGGTYKDPKFVSKTEVIEQYDGFICVTPQGCNSRVRRWASPAHCQNDQEIAGRLLELLISLGERTSVLVSDAQPSEL